MVIKTSDVADREPLALKIQRTYLIKHPLKAVFEVWISPATIVPPVTKLEIAPKVGGIYKLTMPDGMARNGRFLSILPNQSLHFSWQWGGIEKGTDVQVEFNTHSDGSQITIIHSGFRSESSKENHLSGWNNYVSGFQEYLSI